MPEQNPQVSHASHQITLRMRNLIYFFSSSSVSSALIPALMIARLIARVYKSLVRHTNAKPQNAVNLDTYGQRFLS